MSKKTIQSSDSAVNPGMGCTGCEVSPSQTQLRQCERAYAPPFEVSWARYIYRQCRGAGVTFFPKQLSTKPVLGGKPLTLGDQHGGDWGEWPGNLRIRESPAVFRDRRSS